MQRKKLVLSASMMLLVFALIGIFSTTAEARISLEDLLLRIEALEAKAVSLESENADLKSQVTALQTENTSLGNQIAALQNKVDDLAGDLASSVPPSLLALADYVSVEPDSSDDLAGPKVIFTGVNIQLVNGTGSTGDTNGLGNLVVGYNLAPAGLSGVVRDGSHNIVIGDGHEYRNYSELETTSIVALPEALNITSAGQIDVVAGSDLNFIAGNNVSLTAGASAIFNFGSNASFNVGGSGNLNIGSDLSLNVGRNGSISVGADVAFDAGRNGNFMFGADVNLNAGGDANFMIADDLAIDADRVDFSGRLYSFDVYQFLVQATHRIILRSGGDIVFKGTKIEEN